MGKNSATRTKFAGALVVSAVTTAALAASGFGSAPTANATCASFWGIGNGNGCTSTLFNVAIGIGTGATATATGIFGTSFAIGDGSKAVTSGALNTAVALGPGTRVFANGNLGIAIGAGFDPIKTTGATAGYLGTDFANIAVSLGNSSNTDTGYGVGNLALSLGGGNDVYANGSLNTAISVSGNQPFINNDVEAYGFLNSVVSLGGDGNSVLVGAFAAPVNANAAFNVLGNGNTVQAGPGPFAVAGAIFQNGAKISKVGPGFNINNALVVGGAAAVRPASSRVTKPAAAATRTTANPAASRTTKK